MHNPGRRKKNLLAILIDQSGSLFLEFSHIGTDKFAIIQVFDYSSRQYHKQLYNGMIHGIFYRSTV